MWPHVALFIPFYVRISGESVKPGMITAPVIHVPGNIRAYRVLVTANKALVGHFMPGTSVTWKPVPSSWVYFVNSYLKGDKMAKSCDYEAIRFLLALMSANIPITPLQLIIQIAFVRQGITIRRK